MSDPLEERLAALSEPRTMDGEFRRRLERAMTAAAGGPAAANGSPVRWRIDGPREMRPRFRVRLERAMLRRRSPARSLTVRLAAAIAALLVASTVVVVTDRVGAPRHGGSVPLVAAPTATPSAARPPAAAARPPGSLHAFGSPGEFLRYVRGEALKIAGPYGIESVGIYHGAPVPRGPAVVPAPAPGTAPGGAPAAMPAMPNSVAGAYSATNVQEEGVDEPDTVKTDGERLVVVARSELWLLDVTNGGARLRGSVKIPSGIGAFLKRDRVIVFSQLGRAPPEAKKATHALQRPWTKVTVVDIASLSKPKIVSAFEVEGSYVGARLVGGVVRLIILSDALGPEPVAVTKHSQAELAAAEAGNKRAIKSSFVGDWMPHYVVQKPGGGTVTGHVHDWSAVSRPPDKAGVSMLTLLTIDPADPRPDNAQSVMGAGEIVYSSLENLYVTSYRLDDVIALRDGERPKEPLTRIHKFDVRDPTRARYVGSGEVAGFLLNQFSISEHKGYLRVATTLGTNWFAGAASSESAVTVLREKAGKLVRVGSVDNLGLGERIYSVRFIGSMAYVVTFRQIDPLFVIDLRKPTLPKVRGKLKVPGYSGYLHPLSETRLLGIGRDADKNGTVKGIQFSLFDVSDPSNPRRLHDKVVGEQGSSSVESDHHAFMYWAPRRLAVVPAELWEGGSNPKQFIGALALTVSAGEGFGEPVRLTHQGRSKVDPYVAAIQRSLVIGNRLLTVSEAGVLVSDLKTLADRVWVALQA